MNIEDILVPLSFFAAVVLSLYFYLNARNKERLALIEKGLINQVPKKRATNAGLKVGSFCIGLAAGVFMGYILSHYTSINDVVAFFAMILLFGGLSLIFNNFIPDKSEKEEE